MMPESERESSFDPDEEVIWDSDNSLPEWGDWEGSDLEAECES